MAFATCNGIRIYYETHGSGEPLILISGLGGDHTFWTPSLDALSTRFSVISYDTRGIGQTDAPEEPYSMELFAADVVGLMDALGIPKAHVLGFSMGGNIAISLALRHPARVGRLVLAASHAVVPPQIRCFVDMVLELYEGGISTKQMFDLIGPWLFSNEFLSNPANAAFLRYDDSDPYPQPVYAWKAQYLAQRAFDAQDQLAGIEQQTLILGAEQDPFAPLASSEFLHRNIQGSQLKIITGSGHLMNFEYPDLFHRLVLAFLDTPGPSA